MQVSFGGDQWVSLTSKIWKERSPRKSCPFRVMFAFSNDTCGTSVCPISYGICLSCHSLPPAPSSQNQKQSPFRMGTPSSGLAGLLSVRSVGCNLFLLKKGKACIDNMLIGPVLAIWVFKIGDQLALRVGNIDEVNGLVETTSSQARAQCFGWAFQSHLSEEAFLVLNHFPKLQNPSSSQLFVAACGKLALQGWAATGSQHLYARICPGGFLLDLLLTLL